jgi:Fe-S-cluster containining protein
MLRELYELTEKARKKKARKKVSRWAPIRRLAICRRCKGQCCYVKHMVVLLDKEQEERKLHQYRYEKKNVHGCGEKTAVLKKRKDGSCVYYDREKKRCSIYRRRPRACKTFFCGRGRKNNFVWQELLQIERKHLCDPSNQ